MASTAENEATLHTSPAILTTSDCDIEMLPVPEASSPEIPLPLIVEEALIRAEEEGDFIRTSHAAFDQQFVVPFPDPASTLNIHGSSDQGVQGTSSPEPTPLRAASSVNHSEVVHGNGVQSPNISHGVSTLNTPLANSPAMGPHPPPRHLFNDPYEYELEKIRLEEEHLKKSVEETTSQLMAELERKMAEARSEFDRESQEFDAACKAELMEVEAHMGLVRTGSLLGNAFVSKCSEKSASNDLAAVRAAMISQQHSTQQQQAVHMSTSAPPRAHMSTSAPPRVHMSTTSAPPRVHMSTSAPPRPSVEAPVLNSSGPIPHLPRRTTIQPSPVSQQAHTRVNSTAPPPVTAVEPQTPNHLRPLARFPPPTTTQPSPISLPQSNTNVTSTETLPRPSVTTEASLPRPSVTTEAPLTRPSVRTEAPLTRPSVTTEAPLPRPSVTTEAPLTRPSVTTEAPLPRPSVRTEAPIPLHSPLSSTPRPRPRPVIPNLIPTSSSPPVRGPGPYTVRAPPPHIARRPAPHLRQYGSSPASMSAPAAVAATTHPVQEQEQQKQGKSKDGLVDLSDDD